MHGDPNYPTDRQFKAHCISVNCRVVARSADWPMADNAWKKARAAMSRRDVARWDHEFTDGTHHTVRRAST